MLELRFREILSVRVCLEYVGNCTEYRVVILVADRAAEAVAGTKQHPKTVMIDPTTVPKQYHLSAGYQFWAENIC
jgi:hypothetical protein